MNTATDMDPIFQHVFNSDAKKLQDILAKDGVDPNVLQKDGLCPLHVAAVIGNQDVLSILLKHVCHGINSFSYRLNEFFI